MGSAVAPGTKLKGATAAQPPGSGTVLAVWPPLQPPPALKQCLCLCLDMRLQHDGCHWPVGSSSWLIHLHLVQLLSLPPFPGCHLHCLLWLILLAGVWHRCLQWGSSWRWWRPCSGYRPAAFSALYCLVGWCIGCTHCRFSKSLHPATAPP